LRDGAARSAPGPVDSRLPGIKNPNPPLRKPYAESAGFLGIFTFLDMRSRVVPIREMRERFGVQVKAFAPAFVIPRHAPGWEAMDSAEARGLVFRPASEAPAKRPVYIEVKTRE
jgi:hypothetical protein